MMLEIIVLDKAEAKLVKQGHGDRVELIKDFEKGGLSPDLKVVDEVASVDILVNVMVRHTDRSFEYTSGEFYEMVNYIKQVTQKPINGIVFGSHKNRQLDLRQLKVVQANLNGKEFVFHRAFDELDDQIKSIKALSKYGVTHILTSGKQPKAHLNVEYMRQLNDECQKHGIILLVGSGITLDNYLMFNDFNGNEIHVGSGVRANGSIHGAIEVDKIKEMKANLK